MSGLVDNYGHLGGAIVGAAIGLFDRPLLRLSEFADMVPRRVLGGRRGRVGGLPGLGDPRRSAESDYRRSSTEASSSSGAGRRPSRPASPSKRAPRPLRGGSLAARSISATGDIDAPIDLELDAPAVADLALEGSLAIGTMAVEARPGEEVADFGNSALRWPKRSTPARPHRRVDLRGANRSPPTSPGSSTWPQGGRGRPSFDQVYEFASDLLDRLSAEKAIAADQGRPADRQGPARGAREASPQGPVRMCR